MHNCESVSNVEFAGLSDASVLAGFFDWGIAREEQPRPAFSGGTALAPGASRLLELASEGRVRSVRLLESSQVKFRAWETAEDLKALGYRQLAELPHSMLPMSAGAAAEAARWRRVQMSGPPPLSDEERRKRSGDHAGTTSTPNGLPNLPFAGERRPGIC